MKRNYIQPTSENISFSMQGMLAASKVSVVSDGTHTVTGETMGTNGADFEDDIDWDEE